MPNTRNATFDGSCVALRWGAFAIGCIKCEIPKEKGKADKIRLLGEQLATIYTPGIWDVDEGSIEMLSSTFAAQVLPRLPKHGANLFEWVLTATQRHPIVQGPYSIMVDRVRLMGAEEALENAEKGHTIKLPIMASEVWRRGADGVWKSLASKPGLPSPQAQQFMFA